MIQVYKKAFKVRATSLRARRVAEYHRLFFIIPALQSENYNKKSKLKYRAII
jgi:hypothetical protein